RADIGGGAGDEDQVRIQTVFLIEPVGFGDVPVCVRRIDGAVRDFDFFLRVAAAVGEREGQHDESNPGAWPRRNYHRPSCSGRIVVEWHRMGQVGRTVEGKGAGIWG